MFKNIFLDIEALIINEISSNHSIGLEKEYFSVHYVDIDYIDSEMEMGGYDKLKGEEFTLFYDYHLKTGKVQYNNGLIEKF